MDLLRYTLLADGTSDEVLIPVINWLITAHCPGAKILPAFARDIRTVGNGLQERVHEAIRNFPCDLLFVHRDAEGMQREARRLEIDAAMQGLQIAYVPIIPIRMTEAWLLSDEAAIRFAAGNASGRHPLNLPARRQWEALPDPKLVLLNAITAACGLSGRRLNKFSPERARSLVTQRTDSFATLRGLAAFDAFETDLIEQLRGL
jgi:hypothetical protein